MSVVQILTPISAVFKNCEQKTFIKNDFLTTPHVKTFGHYYIYHGQQNRRLQFGTLSTESV